MRRSTTGWRSVVVLAAVAGCSRSVSSVSPRVDEYVVDCTVAEDAGIPGASDEDLAAFLNAEAGGSVTADACRSPSLVGPAPGSLLRSGAPPTISFTPQAPTCDRRERWRSRLRRVLGAVGALIERPAEAHCGAFSGENYYLRLVRAGEARPVYSALLSVTSFTPDSSIWSRALSGRAGQSLSLTIERAVFLQGDITEGPYVQPSPPTFTVAP